MKITLKPLAIGAMRKGRPSRALVGAPTKLVPLATSRRAAGRGEVVITAELESQ